MRYFILTLIYCVSIVSACAQSITGRVMNQETNEPVAYAHVIVVRTGEGTLTDEQGRFRLFTQERSPLRISCVGYETREAFVVAGNEIRLVPSAVILTAVEIVPINPLDLLRQALQKLPNNHGGHRLLTCFYRHTATKHHQYVHVSEALFNLNQHSGEYNQIKLIKAREIEDERTFNGVGMRIGTKLGAVRNIDLTFDATISFLNQKDFKNYDYIYEGIKQHAGIEVHEISFDQKRTLKQSEYKGKLYLSTASLAFVEIDYELSPRGIGYLVVGTAVERAASRLLDLHISLLSQRTVVTYRQFGSQWHLDNIVKYETARVNSKRYNFDVTVDERSDYMVTAIDTTFRKPIDKGEESYSGFMESTTDTTRSFWKDYNIIPAAKNYDSIAQQIEARNGYNVLKKDILNNLKAFSKSKAVQIDSIMTRYHKRAFFNGTVLVKHKGSVIYHKAFGYANRQTLQRNDTATVFRIGSLSKSFTSYIIWKLSEEGLLNYRDSIQRFIPWYSHSGITIEHLLTHASGIPDYTSHPNYLDSLSFKFSLRDIVSKFGSENPLFTPGTDFKYSNTGYTILAYIAEQASGSTFENLLAEKIFKPFRMSNTFLAMPSDTRSATGYLYGYVEPSYAITNVLGAGGLSSTTSDLEQWDKVWYSPGLQSVLKPRTHYKDWDAHYAEGWMIDDFLFRASKKHTIIYHPGTDFGFKTMMARQPDDRNLIILLNNTGEFPLFDITDIILQVLN